MALASSNFEGFAAGGKVREVVVRWRGPFSSAVVASAASCLDDAITTATSSVDDVTLVSVSVDSEELVDSDVFLIVDFGICVGSTVTTTGVDTAAAEDGCAGCA